MCVCVWIQNYTVLLNNLIAQTCHYDKYCNGCGLIEVTVRVQYGREDRCSLCQKCLSCVTVSCQLCSIPCLCIIYNANFRLQVNLAGSKEKLREEIYFLGEPRFEQYGLEQDHRRLVDCSVHRLSGRASWSQNDYQVVEKCHHCHSFLQFACCWHSCHKPRYTSGHLWSLRTSENPRKSHHVHIFRCHILAVDCWQFHGHCHYCSSANFILLLSKFFVIFCRAHGLPNFLKIREHLLVWQKNLHLRLEYYLHTVTGVPLNTVFPLTEPYFYFYFLLMLGGFY